MFRESSEFVDRKIGACFIFGLLILLVWAANLLWAGYGLLMLFINSAFSRACISGLNCWYLNHIIQCVLVWKDFIVLT